VNEETPQSIGQILAAARLAQQRSIEEIASKMKLTSRQIEAIEADNFHEQVAPVFARGFVRNYARLLGIEVQPLLTRLDRDAKPADTLTAPSEGVRVGASPARRWLLLPLIFAAAFLLMVALLYLWLRGGETDLASPDMSVAPEVIETAPILPLDAPPIAPDVAPTVPAPAVEPPAPVVPPTSAIDARAPAVEPVALPPSPPPAPVSNTPGPIAAGNGALAFMASDDAWIQVVDAGGQRYSRLLRAGASDGLRGKPPFRLVIGNAAQVKVTYNDQQVDLTPHIGERVARLTLE